MQNIIASWEIPAQLPHTVLQTIWYVEANHTYNVHRKMQVFPNHFIAIRTVTGKGIMQIEAGTPMSLEADSLCIIPASGSLHYYADREGWQFYWFEFQQSPVQIQRCLTSIPLSVQEVSELEHCFTALSSGNQAQCLLADALFHYLLAQWAAKFSNPGRSDAIISLLAQGRRHGLSIAQMAQKSGMSQRSFRNAVHTAVGMAPTEYLLKGEMAAAMNLLQTTQMPVSQIASCLHYSSPLYFSRVFKKYYGFSPQHIRDNRNR